MTLKDFAILVLILAVLQWLVMTGPDRSNCRDVGRYGETVCD